MVTNETQFYTLFGTEHPSLWLVITTTQIAYTGYLTNRTINGQIAQQQSGATIVLEHRYYGLSNPFNNLSTASLEFHTIQQAIDDLVYFANNVKLPQPDGGDVTPDKAPWVLIGGSYSGKLKQECSLKKIGV